MTIRHDRSVIEARGGVWPAVADAVREDSAAILADRLPEVPVRRRRLPSGRSPISPNTDLLKRRKALGLSQDQLGKMVGYSGGGPISNLERGVRRPSAKMWSQIEKVLAEREA